MLLLYNQFYEIIYKVLKNLLSKLLDRKIRIIRRPFILRGRKYIDFGKGLKQDRLRIA